MMIANEAKNTQRRKLTKTKLASPALPLSLRTSQKSLNNIKKQEAQELGALLDNMEDKDHIKLDNIEI